MTSKKKKTVTIEEHHYEFLDKTNINASKVLREAVNHLRSQMTHEEEELLRKAANPGPEEFEGMEVRE